MKNAKMSSRRAFKRGHLVQKPIWKTNEEGEKYIADYEIIKKTKRGKL
jgi:hypothetical protein